MPDEKNINFMKYWPLAVGIFVVVGTWAGFQAHMGNDAIHINKGENVLTDAELQDLLKFSTQVEQKLPEIETQTNKNTQNIINLDKDFAVFENSFKTLFQEHEGLESKVSRNYVELRDKINEIDN